MTEDQPQPPRPLPPSPHQGLGPSAPGGASGIEFLHDRLKAMERELLWERERAQSAEGRIKEQDALRAEADRQLKEILEHLRQEKAERERSEEKSHDRGRIDALESRLDEMHKTWAGLLKDTIGQREAAKPTAVPEGGGPPSRALEEVRDLISGWNNRMEERIGHLLREKAALQDSLEESRHQIRQEHIKERAAVETRLNQEIQEIRAAMAQLQKTWQDSSGDASKMREAISKILELMSRTPAARDQIIAELEREKADLHQALRDRTDELRRYTLERREVERSMGEALADLNRQLQTQQAKHQETSSATGDLGLQLQSLRTQLEQARQVEQGKDKRWAALAQERDQLLQAMLAETQKVQNQISLRMESEKNWENRFNQLQKTLSEEKTKNLEAQNQISSLRAQLQTVTEHMTRALQDKDRAETQSLSWRKEKDELLATLRQKEEIISMLSATFQNMMKK